MPDTAVDSFTTPSFAADRGFRGWRTVLQVPLLLVAAAGIGFAGQHMWSNRSDVGSLFGVDGTPAGCASHVLGMRSTVVPVSSSAPEALGSGCCSGGGSGGCALATTVARATDSAVSALIPENALESL